MRLVPDPTKAIYWHRELPPLDAEPIGDHTLEATSRRIAGTLGHRDALWRDCERDLITQAEARLLQEMVRLGGRYAHVHDEVIDPRHDERTGEAWLQGRFGYVLYR